MAMPRYHASIPVRLWSGTLRSVVPRCDAGKLSNLPGREEATVPRAMSEKPLGLRVAGWTETVLPHDVAQGCLRRGGEGVGCPGAPIPGKLDRLGKVGDFRDNFRPEFRLPVAASPL